jgi:hypothetical protein
VIALASNWMCCGTRPIGGAYPCGLRPRLWPRLVLVPQPCALIGVTVRSLSFAGDQSGLILLMRCPSPEPRNYWRCMFHQPSL